MDLITGLGETGRITVVHPTLRDPRGHAVQDPEVLRRTYHVRTVLLGSLRKLESPDGPDGSGALVVHLEAIEADENRVEWVENCTAAPGDFRGLRDSLLESVLEHYRLKPWPERQPEPAVDDPADAVQPHAQGWTTTLPVATRQN
jgi:hypothetical protein